MKKVLLLLTLTTVTTSFCAIYKCTRPEGGMSRTMDITANTIEEARNQCIGGTVSPA